jgi:pantothenate synthetase
MLLSIYTHTGQLREILNSDSHAKAIKKIFVNPMKKATSEDYDFVVDTIENGAPIQRTYWIFK